MTYTLTAHPNTIVRDEDGAFIPTDPDNVDYQAYRAWLDEGNQPTPYTPPEAARGSHHNQQVQLVKPEISGSPTTRGNKLNANMDAIDGAMDQNAQAGVPIGSMMMWPVAIPPANWLICDGSPIDTATYAKLLAAISYTFGGSGTSFDLPSLTKKFPLGAGTDNAVGTSGGNLSITLSIGNMPAHSHTATQPAHSHTATESAHSHTATQPAHSHGDQGHWHDPAGSYQDAHNHNYVGPGSGAWNYTTASLQSVNANAVTGNAQPALHISIGVGYANLAAAQPAITVGNAQPAITVGSAQPAITVSPVGTGDPIDITPSFLAIYFIIKYQ